MTDLNSMMAPDSGWILTSSAAINDQGDIVGNGLYDGDGDGPLEQPHGYLMTSEAVDPPVVANHAPPFEPSIGFVHSWCDSCSANSG